MSVTLVYESKIILGECFAKLKVLVHIYIYQPTYSQTRKLCLILLWHLPPKNSHGATVTPIGYILGG